MILECVGHGGVERFVISSQGGLKYNSSVL